MTWVRIGSLSALVGALVLVGCAPTPCDRIKSLKVCNEACAACLGTGPGQVCLTMFTEALTLPECVPVATCLATCPGATTDGGVTAPTCAVAQDCSCSNKCYNNAPNACRQAYENYAGCVTRECGRPCQ